MEVKPQIAKEHVVKILEVLQETPKIRLLRVERPKGIGFLAGQFFMVSLHNSDAKIARAYSLSSSPSNENYLEIGFDKVGELTTKLFELNVGDKLKFKGPYGKFFFDEHTASEVILIGAGTGIAPLMSIIRQCGDKKLKNTIKLIYSVRVPEEIAYRKELEERKKHNPHLDYIVTVTRPEDTIYEWNGRLGRIDEELLKKTIVHPAKSIVFICGAKEFVFGMIEFLQKIGVSKEQIKTDVWG